MKFLPFVSFSLMASIAAAQALADTDELFAREEFGVDESLYARDDTINVASHAARTLEHVRRLADDHAEFAARALEDYVGTTLQRRFVLTAAQKTAIETELIAKTCAGATGAKLEGCKKNCRIAAQQVFADVAKGKTG